MNIIIQTQRELSLSVKIINTSIDMNELKKYKGYFFASYSSIAMMIFFNTIRYCMIFHKLKDHSQ